MTSQLAQSIERLFSSLNPHLDDFDPSKLFISFELNALSHKLTKQQVLKERVRLLQYTQQQIHSNPSSFHFSKDSHVGSRCVNTLLHFVDASVKFMEQNADQSEVMLVGLASQTLSKMLTVNFSVQSSKEFTSLSRKALRHFAKFVTFWNEKKAAVNNVGVNVAIVELLGAFAQRNINLVAEDVQLIESGAQYGMLSLKNNSEANMLCSGTVYALISAFDKEPTQKHKQAVKTIVSALNGLLDECYKFVIPEHDPRENILRHTQSGAKKAPPTLVSSLLKRKNPISSLQYMKLFKSLSHCLQRLLTTPFSFIIELNVKKIISTIKNSVIVESSLKVTDNNKKKMITLQSFYDVIPCIHSETLRTLSALILSTKGTLIPHVNSICIILLQEFKLWSSLEEKPLESFAVYKELVRCISFLEEKFGACVSESLSQKLLPSVQQMILRFYNSTMKYEMDQDVNQDSAAQSLEKFNVTFKKSNKRKRSQETEERSHQSLPLQIQSQYLTLKLLQYILPSTQVNPSLETLSALIDIVTCLTNSLQVYHAHRFAIFQNANSQILNKLFSGIVAEQYRSLYQCMLAGSAINTQSPFLPIAVSLFRKGIQTCIPEIISACTESLQVIESFLHPRSAPLHTPSAESVSIQLSKLLDRERAVNNMLITDFSQQQQPSNEPESDSDDDEMQEQEPEPAVPKKQQKPVPEPVSTPSKKKVQEPEKKQNVKPATTILSVADSDDSEEEEEERPALTKQQLEADIEKAFDKMSDSDDDDNDNLDIDLKDGDDEPASRNIDLKDLQLDFSTI